MASVANRINRGVELLQQGQPGQAADLYRDVLERAPDNPDALHLLSVAVYQTGDAGQAVGYARRAIDLNPRAADYHSNLGRYYFSLGRMADSIAALETAIDLAPRHSLAHYNLALSLLAAGRWDEARERLNQHIAVNPQDPAGHHQLGTMLLDSGQAAESIAYFCRVVELKPDAAEAFNNLGNAVQALDKPADSIDYYRQALRLRPGYAEAAANLGAALQALGRRDEAMAWLEKALAMQPGLIAARGNIGNLLAAERRQEEAIAIYREIVAESPGSAETWNNLGNSLQELGRFDEALEAYRRALEANPRYTLVYNNTGNTLRRQGRYEEAIAEYDKALAARPDFVEAINNKAVALTDLGRSAEAVTLYERAIALKPDYPDPVINLGNVCRDHSRPEQAIALLTRARELAPSNPYVWNNLGCALSDQGEVNQALDCYRRAIELMADNAHAHSNLLLNLHYTGEAGPDQIARAHRHYGERFDARGAHLRAPHANSRDPERPLRIGYVSADFRRHSVAFFLEPVIEHHDRARYEVFCYSDVARPDAITARFAALAGAGWRDVRGYNDERFAALVRADSIDVLVDLGAHTANSRIASFTARPAPVAVTWLGYPDTTGLASVGYRITDALADPPGQTERWHCEELVRLEGGFLCFRPPAGAPDVRPLPSAGGAPFTFGSFNNMAKVSDQTVALWAAILTRVPTARLALKNKALAETAARERVWARFAAHAIGRDRIWMSGPIDSLHGHLEAYAFVDVALDTWPYAGTTTTCEALWMGVPVVTLAGAAHVSRVGVSLLAAVGLEDLAAHSPDEYIGTACAIAAHPEPLAALRAGLRARMQASALTEEAGFTRKLEDAYRRMWRRWANKETPQ